MNARLDYRQAGHGEEVDGTCSEDDSSLPKGLRRTQSVKMSRAKVVRKEVCMHTPEITSLFLKEIDYFYSPIK